MKIKKSELKRIIQEEISTLQEFDQASFDREQEQNMLKGAANKQEFIDLYVRPKYREHPQIKKQRDNGFWIEYKKLYQKPEGVAEEWLEKIKANSENGGYPLEGGEVTKPYRPSRPEYSAAGAASLAASERRRERAAEREAAAAAQAAANTPAARLKKEKEDYARLEAEREKCRGELHMTSVSGARRQAYCDSIDQERAELIRFSILQADAERRAKEEATRKAYEASPQGRKEKKEKKAADAAAEAEWDRQLSIARSRDEFITSQVVDREVGPYRTDLQRAGDVMPSARHAYQENTIKQMVQEELEAVLGELIRPNLRRARATATAGRAFVDDPSPRHASDVARAAIGLGKIPTKGQHDPSKMKKPEDWKGDRAKAATRAHAAWQDPDARLHWTHELEIDPRPPSLSQPSAADDRATAAAIGRGDYGQEDPLRPDPHDVRRDRMHQEGLIKQMVQEELEAVLAERNK